MDSKDKNQRLLEMVLMGISDVLANAAVVKAFETTSSVSVMVISSMSMVFAIAFGITVLQKRYFKVHFAGVVICLSGLSCILYAKVKNINDEERLAGDFYALAASFGYALSNTLNEKLSMNEPGYPFAAIWAMGLFGSITGGITVCFAGTSDIEKLKSIPAFDSRLNILWVYPLIMVVLYLLIPKYVQVYSSVVYNFHILTADVYVFFYSFLFAKAEFTLIYLIGVGLVFAGLLVYSLVEPEFVSTNTASYEPLLE